MRDYSQVSATFWTGETGRALRVAGRDVQAVAMYLITSPDANMIGLYPLALPTLVHHVAGMTSEGAREALRRVGKIGFAHFEAEEEVVFIPEMARYQIGEKLKPGDKRIKGVARELQRFRKSVFFQKFMDRYAEPFHLAKEVETISRPEAPSKPLRSQEQEQEQEQEQDIESAAQISGETLNASTPAKQQPKNSEIAILTFPCDGAVREWAFTQSLGDELQKLYPELHILAEARASLAWILAKPNRRKTARGMRSFLTNWLNNSQNNPRRRATPANKPVVGGSFRTSSQLNALAELQSQFAAGESVGAK